MQEEQPATVQLVPKPLLGPPSDRLETLWALARRLWPIWLVAGVTLANGLLGIVSVLVVRFHDRPALFNVPLPFGLYHWSRSLTLAFGLVLVYLSFHLLERRRTAWALALGGAVLAAAAHVGRGQQWYAALASAALVLLLLLFRTRFTVHSEPRSIAQGVGLMLIGLILALAYGTIGFWLLDKKDFGLEFHAVDALVRTLREFSLVGNSDLVAHTRHARWFLDSLHAAGLTAGAFALYSLFRPVAYRQRTLPQQRALMKSLLEQYGGTSLDYFKLWPDKSYFFSPDRTCGIAYRTVGGVALVLGNPVGAPEGLEATTRRFLRFCDDNGWEATFDAVPADLLPMYHRLGLQSLKIGIEAVVPLDRIPDTVKHSKHLRHIRNKFEGEGYRFERHMPPHDGALMSQLREVSDEWLQIPGRRERSFTVGYFDEGYVNECPVVALQDPSGRLVAFANEIPSYRAGEATIDMMRHRPQAPNGAMDYLFIALMLALRETGYRTFNLGMAPLAGVGEGPDASLEERAAHELAEHATRIFAYKGMRDYKGKFDPQWEDRFLIYQGGPLGLARSVVALVRTTEHSPLGQKR
jgi:phosphatidylglycerol lysyltransferase